MTIAICIVACAVLLGAEYAGARRGGGRAARVRAIAKAVASAAFVARGMPALGAGPYETAVVVGLVLGALGDLALLGSSKRAFLAGLALFLGGHLAYVVGFATLEAPQYWLIFAGPFAAIAIIAAVLVLGWLWPHTGNLRWPVLAYVIAIVAMVIGAFAVRSTGALPSPQRTYVAIGAALFFVSDLAVARERFVARDVRNRLWGLPAYYAAQLLIASSI